MQLNHSESGSPKILENGSIHQRGSDKALKQKYTWLLCQNLWSFYLKSSKREENLQETEFLEGDKIQFIEFST